MLWLETKDGRTEKNRTFTIASTTLCVRCDTINYTELVGPDICYFDYCCTLRKCGSHFDFAIQRLRKCQWIVFNFVIAFRFSKPYFKALDGVEILWNLFKIFLSQQKGFIVWNHFVFFCIILLRILSLGIRISSHLTLRSILTFQRSRQIVVEYKSQVSTIQNYSVNCDTRRIDFERRKKNLSKCFRDAF